MTSPFAERLGALSRIRGVAGALVVGESDGLVVDAMVQPDSHADIVAALAASLYRRARMAAGSSGLGGAGFLQLESDDGRVLVAGVPGAELVIVAIADGRANLGLIRVEMLRSAAEIK